VMWGCEWKVRRTDPYVGTFVEQLNLRKPLIIKEAFRGGRTNAAKLLHVCEGDETISHIDMVSMYPFVNKHEAYPIGHPEIILDNFQDIKEYFGIVKCKVKAPPTDYFPPLPSSIKGKLVFTLC